MANFYGAAVFVRKDGGGYERKPIFRFGVNIPVRGFLEHTTAER